MTSRLMKHAEDLARQRQQECLRKLAEQLRNILSEAAIEVEEARVLVRGRGIVKRWLLDPSLRFLARGLK